MKGHLAWKTLAEPVPLHLELAVDGRPVVLDDAEREQHAVALHERSGEAWEQLTLTVQTDLPDDVAHQLQRPLDDIATTIGVSCRATHLRQGLRLLPATSRPAAARAGTIQLWRDELQGRVDVTVDVTIAKGPAAHRLLGSSRTWAVAVDPPAEGPSGAKSSFRVEWDDFTRPERNHLLAGHADAPAYLDLGGGADPVLYLNTSIPGLQQLLGWDRARTTARDARDLISSTIAAGAIQVIVAEALDQVSVSDDGPEVPGLAVLDNALELVARRLPSVSSLDELLERVVNDRDAGAEDELRAEVAATITRVVAMGETFGRAATRATDG